ncbi:monofunctional biosynthetic peptidoglycan transglycosylase [Palleronia sediminis]|uniref:Biosynthetic peptidoglycan transglycosylase n=1 Tax=Palleronia sediminis TaxID=2547833 RepID=A0A4R6ACK2_9RHOB|nr:monofunctional biosynthetic peptidoglycan transglycosylase [Palleronia sediminis]TDL81550.1 monofunctional biosynthetic peptidoglycan transglycosylase [Palleronia sediminis]
MARAAKSTAKRKPRSAAPPAGRRFVAGLRRWALRSLGALVALVLAAVLVFSVFNPPTTPYMSAERVRLGAVDHEWIPIGQIAPVMLASVVAAEDARFCDHWGFDVPAIRAAIEAGGRNGASTITQQVVKNVYLWQGRSWARKAIEALLTPLVEAFWSKRRILEVYLNVAEFGEGVFGIDAASYAAFRVPPARLDAEQAARLAAVLPAPKRRSAASPTQATAQRAARIRDGAATIVAQGRDACFRPSGD